VVEVDRELHRIDALSWCVIPPRGSPRKGNPARGTLHCTGFPPWPGAGSARRDPERERREPRSTSRGEQPLKAGAGTARWGRRERERRHPLFLCGTKLGILRSPELDDGSECPACRDRLLDALPPLLRGAARTSRLRHGVRRAHSRRDVSSEQGLEERS
jgi:hypothetical protein